MRIVSQNKKQDVPYDECGCSLLEVTGIESLKIFKKGFNIILDGKTSVGIYKSEEKALKVMKTIRSVHSGNKAFKNVVFSHLGGIINTEDKDGAKKEILNFCEYFYMPLDKDVEVSDVHKE